MPSCTGTANQQRFCSDFRRIMIRTSWRRTSFSCSGFRTGCLEDISYCAWCHSSLRNAADCRCGILSVVFRQDPLKFRKVHNCLSPQTSNIGLLVNRDHNSRLFLVPHKSVNVPYRLRLWTNGMECQDSVLFYTGEEEYSALVWRG